MPRRVSVALMCVFLPVLYALARACGFLVIVDNRSALSFVLTISLATSFSTNPTHALSTQARKYCHVSIVFSDLPRLFARCLDSAPALSQTLTFHRTTSERRHSRRDGARAQDPHDLGVRFCLRDLGLVLNLVTWLTGSAWLEFWGLCSLVLLLRSVHS